MQHQVRVRAAIIPDPAIDVKESRSTGIHRFPLAGSGFYQPIIRWIERRHVS